MSQSNDHWNVVLHIGEPVGDAEHVIGTITTQHVRRFRAACDGRILIRRQSVTKFDNQEIVSNPAFEPPGDLIFDASVFEGGQIANYHQYLAYIRFLKQECIPTGITVVKCYSCLDKYCGIAYTLDALDELEV